MKLPVPHIVQYQGSKRILAPQILRYMPKRFKRMVEPFAGSAAMTIAAASEMRAESYLVNDLNGPLVGMIEAAISRPDELLRNYAAVWEAQFSFPGGRVMVKLPKEIRDRLESVAAKRPRTVVRHILKHGSISSQELLEVYGYEHPPRAIRDVRELGIPIVTAKTKDKTGKSIGVDAKMIDVKSRQQTQTKQEEKHETAESC